VESRQYVLGEDQEQNSRPGSTASWSRSCRGGMEFRRGGGGPDRRL